MRAARRARPGYECARTIHSRVGPRSPRKPPGPPSRTRRGVGRSRRDRQLDLRAESGLAPQIETAADETGAFAHAGQAEVSLPWFVQHLRIDALPVVAHAHLKLLVVVPYRDFDVARAGVSERIAQRLARDAVDVVAENGMEIPGRAFDGDVHDHRGRVRLIGLVGRRELSAERANGFGQI